MDKDEIVKQKLSVYKYTSTNQRVSKEFLRMLKVFRDDLKVAFNKKLKRFAIYHEDRITGLIRPVKVIETETGGYREPIPADIGWLQKNIHWDLLDKFKDPEEMWKHVDQADKKHEEKLVQDRKEDRRVMYEENKGLWDKAFDNFRSGRLVDPYNKYKPKAKPVHFIPKGFNQEGSILLPKFKKGE